METIIKNSPHSQIVETTIPLTLTSQYTLTTMKRYNGEMSTVVRKEEIYKNRFITYSPFSDFSKTLASKKILRVTKKALMTQHVECLNKFVKDLKSDNII